MNRLIKKEWFYRASRTFLQSFFGVIATSALCADLSSDAVLKGLLISAIASGMSAVMNLEKSEISE